ncbi:MAG: ferredoxin [Chloroflexota bacterium]|nr:ferredoxin [Chloroflexota bacterium]
MCITIATKAFELNAERQAQSANPDGDTEELILEAAENCPVAAITVTDSETGEQLFP